MMPPATPQTAPPVPQPKPKPLAPTAPPPRLRDRPWWPWLTRGTLLGFAAMVIGLLVWQATRVDWPAVFANIRATPARVLVGAAAVALGGHLLYSCFDLLGRRYTGHWLRARAAMLVTFVSYAFNLNFGAIVGGGAMRLRLYSRLGLPTPIILRVMALSMWTNWFGYLALAGLTFLALPLPLPAGWHVDAGVLPWLGGVLLACAAAYLGACAAWPRRTWVWRGHAVHLPSVRMALAQLAMSAANWLMIAAVIWVLLQGKVAFAVVASVFLVGVVVGIATRVPAGLGVQEAVFVALLADQMPKAEVLAALLTYRALYYWAPLLVAGLAYAVLEMRAPRVAADGAAVNAPTPRAAPAARPSDGPWPF